MSHVQEGGFRYVNLDVVEETAKEFGAVLVRGVKSYQWYGHSAGDYPMPKGFLAEDLGKCDHVIRLPGCSYEIGLLSIDSDGVPCRRSEKPHATYAALYDFWGPGKLLKKTFADKLDRFADTYKHNTIMRSLKPGQRAWRVNNAEEAKKVSVILKKPITYGGKMLTVIAS